MNCGIIRDLLPLYHDGVCSPESRAEVEEHLKNCPECRRVLEAVDGPLPEVEKAAADDAEAVRRLSGAWRKGRRLAGILGGIAVLTVCAAIAGGALVPDRLDSGAHGGRGLYVGAIPAGKRERGSALGFPGGKGNLVCFGIPGRRGWTSLLPGAPDPSDQALQIRL